MSAFLYDDYLKLQDNIHAEIRGISNILKHTAILQSNVFVLNPSIPSFLTKNTEAPFSFPHPANC